MSLSALHLAYRQAESADRNLDVATGFAGYESRWDFYNAKPPDPAMLHTAKAAYRAACLAMHERAEWLRA